MTEEREVFENVVLYTLYLSPVGFDGTLDDDRADGEHQDKNAQGLVVYSSQWLAGMRHGVSILYAHGRPVHRVPFFNAVRAGEEEIYNSDGKCIYRAEWRGDTLHGEVMVKNPLDPDQDFINMFFVNGKLDKTIYKNGQQELVSHFRWDLTSPFMIDVVGRLVKTTISAVRKQVVSENRRASVENITPAIIAAASDASITKVVVPLTIAQYASSSSSSINGLLNREASPSISPRRDRSGSIISNQAGSRIRRLIRSTSFSGSSRGSGSSGGVGGDDEDSSSVASSASEYARRHTESQSNPFIKSSTSLKKYYVATGLEDERQSALKIIGASAAGSVAASPMSPKLRVGDMVIIDAEIPAPQPSPKGKIGRRNRVHEEDEEDELTKAINLANKQAKAIEDSQIHGDKPRSLIKRMSSKGRPKKEKNKK
jgi:hypothetical protein